jgi:formate hydrogenlyase subunit 4
MISLILILITAMLFIGVLNRTRSLLSGRQGPGFLQVWKDLFRLFRKGSTFSTTTSIIFQIAPSVYFGSIIMAILVVPFANQEGILSFEGDFIFFIYALAIGKFFMIISALDTGSGFEGMGANREALYSLLVEPAFFILIGSFSMLSGNTSFYKIYQTVHFGSYESYLLCLVAGFVLIQIGMIENSRLPIDDPKTHLELTMVHEVMILDNSGFDLGLITLGTSLKFAMYGALVANFFIEPPKFLIHYIAEQFAINTSMIGTLIQIIMFLAIQFLWAITVGISESFRARARMKRNPLIIFTLTAIAILIFFGVLIIMKKFQL